VAEGRAGTRGVCKKGVEAVRVPEENTHRTVVLDHQLPGAAPGAVPGAATKGAGDAGSPQQESPR
jgi:hypothetical protein